MVRPEERKKSAKDEEAKEDKEEGEDEENKAEEEKENEFVDNKRLFVMNLSYQVTKEELQELFGKYGEIDDIEIPFRKHGKGVPLGIGFVKFATSESAISAFAELDKTYFQGRKIHIKPSEKKPPPVEQQPNMYPPDHPEYKYQQAELAK